ncbi:ras GTPase-activating protein 4-like isoform X3 [Parus major]|uniref:ras GTPase-activating protein 4-like isoform X3 n=1 Tax=Parus major TaxID=9157 RepID=UPI0007714BDE|nr:ras GTPase-activating protein 4-like isoform X3 [Parus major]
MVVAALPTLCIPGGVPRGVPIPVEVLGSGDTLGLQEAAVASLVVCDIGLQVPGVVLGKGWVLFAPCFPVWKRKSHFWQPAGRSGRTRSGRSVPGLEAKLGSPCAGSCGQVPPWKPLAASVPQPHPLGFVSTSTGSSDPYCIVKIDDEAIIRTATVWKTLSPFWGEEYEVQLQPGFHSISIYVMDEDALSRDDIIGKVCITRDMLAEHPKGYSGWMSLSEVDPDEEVQGEIHLRVEVLGSQGSRRLRCSVLEARDLARKDRNGASDPFVRLRYNGKTQESTVVKKSCYPRWNETFEFELAEPAGEKLCVEVWDWDLVGRNDFLGKVVFSIQGLEVAGQEEGWFRLWPDKSKPTEDERRGSLGSLQLQVKLRDETVLPSHCYQPLVQLLCQEVKLGRQDGQVHLVTLLDETTTAECRQEVAINLVKLFLGQGLVKEFLDLLFELELAKPCEPNTLFRSNSLASKSMESFLKVTGMPYLHFVLGPTIARVFEEKKYVELDPGKVEIKDVGCSGLHRVQTEGEVIEQSRQHLQSYLGELLDAIVRSAPACPPLVRAAFRQLFQRVGERFPQHQLPVPALLLSGRDDPQAVPAAGRARRRADRPHSAAAGQGHPAGREHGAGGRACQGDVAVTAAARPAAGHRPHEGLHHPPGGHGGGRGRGGR